MARRPDPGRAGSFLLVTKDHSFDSVLRSRPRGPAARGARRPKATPRRRRSRPRRFPTSWPAATFWASPRPAPARPRPSRCRSCTGSPPTAGQPTPHSCRVLVLAPTRELASQIEESFETYGRNLRADLHRRLRRRRHAPPGADHGPRRRHPGGDAGPAGRPHEPAHDPARPGRGGGAGRGRPHARHRLHPRHPAGDEPRADQAAEPVLLGHPAQGHRGPGGRAAQGPGHGQGGAGRHHRRAGRAAGGPCRPGRRRRPCWPSSWPSRR